LIIFGLETGSAEAIRLGEKMMSEIGHTLSRDLQKAVKQFMMDNTDKYQQAAKVTGPIDNATLYRSMKAKKDREGPAPIMFTASDPYWQELL
jgi:hypothetical protein